MSTHENYSLLHKCPAPEPLPLVLARLMVATPLGNTERHNLFNRLYCWMSPANKIRCQRELQACRMAKRGQLEAVVA